MLTEIEKEGANAIWISALDAIAWLFNIRDTDVLYNPVVVAYAWVSLNETILFVDQDKLSPMIIETLKNESIRIVAYSQHDDFLSRISNFSICIDSSKLSYSIYQKIIESNWIAESLSIVDRLKSRKNEVEVDGFPLYIIVQMKRIAPASYRRAS